MIDHSSDFCGRCRHSSQSPASWVRSGSVSSLPRSCLPTPPNTLPQIPSSPSAPIPPY
ncbi:hypothetical protein K456DRAFT_46453 [Colletotrichum gloeosporioides 23]|nr:hypothetical protein K456DRAFT_46453 [Colletotrichum gloeosporioides 23]